MSELRHDPIQKRWVIIASDRGKDQLTLKKIILRIKQHFVLFVKVLKQRHLILLANY